MSVPEPNAQAAHSEISRVALRLPGRREMLWIGADAVMTGWEVGEVVVFRNSRWRVLDRTCDGDTLTLTLRTCE
jgi:hypothetical protein